jgi:UBX domain-containing protein 1
VDGQAHMDLEDKGDEEYVPPHVPYVAFGGAGSSLGGPAAAMEGATVTPEAFQAAQAPALDDAAPSTTLQIRMHDGKKLKIK